MNAAFLVLCAACLALSLACAAGTPADADYFAAPNGDDGNPGSKEKPFATLSRARDAVRGKIKAGLNQNITVLVRGGTYELAEPLAFGPEDSGTEKFSITYAAYPGERPVISGGRKVIGWKKDKSGQWTATLSEVEGKQWYFRQLFVNGKRAVRARYPNPEALLRIKTVSPDAKTITFDEPFGKENLAGQNAELVVFEQWAVSRALIVSFNESSVATATPAGVNGHAPYTQATPGKHAFLEHARSFVDAPGEWYLDRASGILVYIPQAGEDVLQSDIRAPYLEQLLTISGTGKTPVRNLHFQSLRFEHAEFPLPPQGYSELQAGHYTESVKSPIFVLPPAVECVYAQDCRFENCRITHTGATGLGFGCGCRRNAATGCIIEDIGGSGVQVGWTGKGKRDLSRLLDGDWLEAGDAPFGNEISNCLVQRCGVMSQGCVGIHVGLSAGTRVAHNEVRDMPYTGISVGWRWGEPVPTSCQNNLIEYNHIHNVMMLLADGGGIYTLGNQPGTVLRGNLIYDVHRSRTAEGSPNNGIFFDQGSKGYRIEGNVIYSTTGESIRFNKCARDWHFWGENSLGIKPIPEPAALKKARAEAGPELAFSEMLLGIGR